MDKDKRNIKILIMTNNFKKLFCVAIYLACIFYFSGCCKTITTIIYPYEQLRLEIDTVFTGKTPCPEVFDTVIIHQKTTGIKIPYLVKYKICKGDSSLIAKIPIEGMSIGVMRVIIPGTEKISPPILRKKSEFILELCKDIQLLEQLQGESKRRLSSGSITNMPLKENMEQQIEERFNDITKLYNYFDSLRMENITKDTEKRAKDFSEKVRMDASTYFNYIWEIDNEKFAKQYINTSAFDLGSWELSKSMESLLNQFTEEWFKHVENFEKDFPKYKVSAISLRIATYADESNLDLSLQKKLEEGEDIAMIPKDPVEKRKWYNKKLSEKRAGAVKQIIYKSLEEYNVKNKRKIKLEENSNQGRGEELPNGIQPPYPEKDNRRRIFQFHLTFKFDTSMLGEN